MNNSIGERLTIYSSTSPMDVLVLDLVYLESLNKCSFIYFHTTREQFIGGDHAGVIEIIHPSKTELAIT